MNDLILTKTKDNDVLTVVANGRIDADNSSEFREEIKCSLDGITKIVFDFQDLTYISSAGLRVLLDLYKLFKNKMPGYSDIVIRKPTETVYETLDVTGYVDILTIEM